MPGITEDEPITKKPNTLSITQIANPSSGKLEDVYKNIENEPIIDRIKILEEKLDILMGIQSVELDIEETCSILN